jgi:hypothetical protein
LKSAPAILRELAGLFVEDGALALGILAVVGAAGLHDAFAPTVGWMRGAALLLGCFGMLAASVFSARRQL